MLHLTEQINKFSLKKFQVVKQLHKTRMTDENICIFFFNNKQHIQNTLYALFFGYIFKAIYILYI